MSNTANNDNTTAGTSFKPAGQEIFQDIKQKIINGEYLPGDHLLSERKLMEVYHRSRPTIREALHMLERAGFIKIIPRSGPIVLEYNSRGIKKPIHEAIEVKQISLREVKEFREVLEGATASWAAERRTEDDIRDIHNCLLQMWESTSDYEAFLQLDVEFHQLLAVAAKNRASELILSSISEVSRELTRQSLSQKSARAVKQRCKLIYKLHLDIYEKIRDKDPEGARAAMIYHLNVFERDVTNDAKKRGRKKAKEESQ